MVSFSQMKKLIKTYFKLKPGDLIKNHDQKMLLFMYKKKRFVMSRRALKHFVERRKSELIRYHSKKQVRKFIWFAIQNIRGTILNPDVCNQEKTDSYFYIKDYSSQDKSTLRILVQEKEGTSEIQSVHFRKKKKDD